MILQQGDVFLEPVETIPTGEKVKAGERGYVLAEGEVTGHSHRITQTKSVTMTRTSDGQVYLEVIEFVPLEHEEHKTTIVFPNKYRVGKVIERDHFERVTREVID